MDNERFDRLTRMFGTGDTRRGLLAGVAKGGVAALLAAVGVTALDGDDAEAANCGARCGKLKRAGKRRCMARCRSANQKRAQRRRLAQLRRRSRPFTVIIGGGTVINGGDCTTNAECASGNCAPGTGASGQATCQPCTGVRLCANGTVCCTANASCVTDILGAPGGFCLVA